MRAIAVLLLAVAPAAWAGSVHKCKGADGVFTYQQTPCESDEAQVSTRRIPASDERAAPLPALATEPQAGQSEGYAPADPYAPTAEQSSTAQPGQARAFQCDDGRKRWIQEEPCPATVNRYHTSTGPAFVPETGQVVNATITTRTREKVDSEALNKSELCDRVRSGAATSRKGSAGDSAYDRNKMRDEHGC